MGTNRRQMFHGGLVGALLMMVFALVQLGCWTAPDEVGQTSPAKEQPGACEKKFVGTCYEAGGASSGIGGGSGEGGSSGQGGSSGSTGSGGSDAGGAGESGAAGAGGEAGNGGASGDGGVAGDAGAGGEAGNSGASGAAGESGTAGVGGESGSSGQGGAAGIGGAGSGGAAGDGGGASAAGEGGPGGTTSGAAGVGGSLAGMSGSGGSSGAGTGGSGQAGVGGSSLGGSSGQGGSGSAGMGGAGSGGSSSGAGGTSAGAGGSTAGSGGSSGTGASAGSSGQAGAAGMGGSNTAGMGGAAGEGGAGGSSSGAAGAGGATMATCDGVVCPMGQKCQDATAACQAVAFNNDPAIWEDDAAFKELLIDGKYDIENPKDAIVRSDDDIDVAAVVPGIIAKGQVNVATLRQGKWGWQFLPPTPSPSSDVGQMIQDTTGRVWLTLLIDGGAALCVRDGDVWSVPFSNMDGETYPAVAEAQGTIFLAANTGGALKLYKQQSGQFAAMSILGAPQNAAIDKMASPDGNTLLAWGYEVDGGGGLHGMVIRKDGGLPKKVTGLPAGIKRINDISGSSMDELYAVVQMVGTGGAVYRITNNLQTWTQVYVDTAVLFVGAFRPFAGAVVTVGSMLDVPNSEALRVGLFNTVMNQSDVVSLPISADGGRVVRMAPGSKTIHVFTQRGSGLNVAKHIKGQALP